MRDKGHTLRADGGGEVTIEASHEGKLEPESDKEVPSGMFTEPALTTPPPRQKHKTPSRKMDQQLPVEMEWEPVVIYKVCQDHHYLLW